MNSILLKQLDKFIITQDLGLKFSTLKSTRKIRYIEAKCKYCCQKYTGAYPIFLRNKRVCACQKSPAFTKERKRIYSIHYSMLSRCFDNSNHNFKYYGARGITVCDEWNDSYEPFYQWAKKNGYESNLTIDRIDNNKNYSTENCKWSTPKEQARNKRGIISEDKVKAIKKLLLQKIPHRKIADLIETSIYRVNAISQGRSWIDI